jgi:hypothetical protein
MACVLTSLIFATALGFLLKDQKARIASGLSALGTRAVAFAIPAAIGLLPMPGGAYISADRRPSVRQDVAQKPPEDLPQLLDAAHMDPTLAPLPGRLDYGNCPRRLGVGDSGVGMTERPFRHGGGSCGLRRRGRDPVLPPSLAEVLDALASHRVVIAADLNLDFRGEPFETTMRAMAYADKAVSLTAVCKICGRPATRMQRLINGRHAPRESPHPNRRRGDLQSSV